MQKIGSRLKYAEICHIHDFEKWEKCGNIRGSPVSVIEGGVTSGRRCPTPVTCQFRSNNCWRAPRCKQTQVRYLSCRRELITTNHVEGRLDLVTTTSRTSMSAGQVKDSEFVNQDAMFSRTAPNSFWTVYTLWSAGFRASRLLYGLWMHAAYCETMTWRSGMVLISA